MYKSFIKKLLLALLVLVPLGLVALVFPPDGRERAAWIQFIGRFHPVVVHLPIGFILLVPLMEVLGGLKRLSFLRLATGFVLAMAAVAAMTAIAFGWMLAYSGGYDGDLVQRHMWGGVALAGSCWLALALHSPPNAGTGGLRKLAYAMTLMAGCGILMWTSHQGGSLTRGEDYLTDRMPPALRTVLRVKPPGSRMTPHEPEDAFYATHIQLIIENRCLLCHSASKKKGGLRLDSFALLMKGGEHGAVIAASDPEKSELYRRITLPEDHKDFMPSEGKRPLTAREVKLFEQWIKTGASPKETMAQLVKKGAEFPPDDVMLAAAPMAPDYHPFSAAILELEGKLGLRLVPISQQVTDGLILRTASNPEKIDDAALQQLAPVAELIVEAELARTKVSDQGLPAIARFTNLRKLDLSNTIVTAAGLPKLASLPHLEWLSLVGAPVGNAPALATFPALKKSYLFETQPPAAEKARPSTAAIEAPAEAAAK